MPSPDPRTAPSAEDVRNARLDALSEAAHVAFRPLEAEWGFFAPEGGNPFLHATHKETGQNFTILVPSEAEKPEAWATRIAGWLTSKGAEIRRAAAEAKPS